MQSRMWLGAGMLVGIAALLAGCSLPASLVPGEPNMGKYSDKPPKELAACVLPAWQSDVSRTTQTSISNGYRITAPSIITADEILDIVKYKDGSRVSLYQGPPWAKSAAMRKAVRDCL
ncbi:hypothetical protein K9857_14080 [Pseudomonas sp. REP124]|uniref:hypothetical protein n=1 Tax=Pseudomonas sp. REP124 TaxID=2875731 RepID=UPI001CC94775|nr:hypothetical protein [Pseudomonas sp. REP124]MBZ9782669.1 hypothetical protein [Pseudomonas sp. REP124]